MALTHVCMWVDKSWEKISACEAAKIFPWGTSAYSGLFMCELCGQYVALTNGAIQNRHFRHSPSEKNKECPDRSETYSYYDFFRAEAHNLPIRLKLISTKDFSLEVGLIPLPDAMRRDAADSKISITGVECFTYSFSRLISKNVTYLDIGTKLAPKYNISVSPSVDGIRFYWPSVIDGLDREGTLFDKETGKKLPYDADVKVGQEYYLVLDRVLSEWTNAVQYKEVCSKIILGHIWRVYEIKAQAFHEAAAKFFLRFHCRLTDKPVTMYPIWPVYTESPYIVYHKGNQMNVFFQGNAELKLAPVGSISRYPYANPKMLSITSSGRQQLLSAGRMEVLKYMYFWESELDKRGELPRVEVTDIKGNLIVSGEQDKIPEMHILCIMPEVDGKIIVCEEGSVVGRYRLNAGQSFELTSIRYGWRIQIFQGLDCVWDSTFKRRFHLSTDRETKLLSELETARGKRLRVHHSLGNIANRFKDMPRIQKWIMKNVRLGYIDERAVQILEKYICEECR